MSVILSLDLGTQTGWALNKSGSITSGTYSFKPHRFEGGGMRYLRFLQWLKEVKEITSFDTVYFEEVRRHKGTDAAHAYGGFLASLTSWCEEHNIPYQGIPVSHIKQFATGRGNAHKEDVVEAMKERGFKPFDDNEADALALLLMVKSQSVDC